MRRNVGDYDAELRLSAALAFAVVGAAVAWGFHDPWAAILGLAPAAYLGATAVARACLAYHLFGVSTASPA